MANHKSFKGHCIVSCGMLYPELNYLMKVGFLNPYEILFTPPRLHTKPDELERQLVRRLKRARESCPSEKIIVAYGEKCYLNLDRPFRKIDMVIEERGKGISRVQADYGYDMLAGIEERTRMSGGEPDKVLWFTPGWLRSWKRVYQRYFGWDRADANANFPGFYWRIVVLDSIGMSDKYIEEHPEKVLELFDWTGLEVEFQKLSLDGLKRLLLGYLL